MILSRDINPEHSLYHTGAYVLEALIANNKESSFSVLFRFVQSHYQININQFSLALDWLYLLDAITLEKGVIKCI